MPVLFCLSLHIFSVATILFNFFFFGLGPNSTNCMFLKSIDSKVLDFYQKRSKNLHLFDTFLRSWPPFYAMSLLDRQHSQSSSSFFPTSVLPDFMRLKGTKSFQNSQCIVFFTKKNTLGNAEADFLFWWRRTLQGRQHFSQMQSHKSFCNLDQESETSCCSHKPSLMLCKVK